MQLTDYASRTGAGRHPIAAPKRTGAGQTYRPAGQGICALQFAELQAGLESGARDDADDRLASGVGPRSATRSAAIRGSIRAGDLPANNSTTVNFAADQFRFHKRQKAKLRAPSASPRIQLAPLSQEA
jgi:hypothetical protein